MPLSLFCTGAPTTAVATSTSLPLLPRLVRFGGGRPPSRKSCPPLIPNPALLARLLLLLALGLGTYRSAGISRSLVCSRLLAGAPASDLRFAPRVDDAGGKESCDAWESASSSTEGLRVEVLAVVDVPVVLLRPAPFLRAADLAGSWICAVSTLGTVSGTESGRANTERARTGLLSGSTVGGRRTFRSLEWSACPIISTSSSSTPSALPANRALSSPVITLVPPAPPFTFPTAPTATVS
jgi:hypothetical protein